MRFLPTAAMYILITSRKRKTHRCDGARGKRLTDLGSGPRRGCGDVGWIAQGDSSSLQFNTTLRGWTTASDMTVLTMNRVPSGETS